MPHIGLALERVTGTASTFGSIDFEWNCAGVGGTGKTEVVKLGRMDTDNNWAVLHWNLMHAFNDE